MRGVTLILTVANGLPARRSLHFHPSCSTLVGHQEAGLCPVLPRRADGFPDSGFAASLPRLILGVHGCGVVPPETGERTLEYLVSDWLVCGRQAESGGEMSPAGHEA